MRCAETNWVAIPIGEKHINNCSPKLRCIELVRCYDVRKSMTAKLEIRFFEHPFQAVTSLSPCAFSF
jgi:hypothetical protein